MSTNSGKMYSRSHFSERAESASCRVEQGDGGPNTTCHRECDEQAASSNAAPLQPIPRLPLGEARHTINDNQAQCRSNTSAPDLRGHLNDKRAESSLTDNDEFGPRCFVSAIRNERRSNGR